MHVMMCIILSEVHRHLEILFGSLNWCRIVGDLVE
jgi:hypothetical protein